MKSVHHAGTATQRSYATPGLPSSSADLVLTQATTETKLASAGTSAPYGVNLTLAMPTMDDYIASHDSTRWIIDLRGRQDTEIIGTGT